MRVAIYQPRYFPQLHYFQRMFSVQQFVLLESAQYTKSLVHDESGKRVRHPSYQSTTPIKTHQGVLLLGIPIKHTGYSPLNQTVIAYREQWVTKHLNVIKNGYQKSPFFAHIFSDVEELLSIQYENLAALNKKTILWAVASLLEFHLPISKITEQHIQALITKANIYLKKFVGDSVLGVFRPEGLHKGTAWTVAICEKLHATEYVHGETAQSGYMDYAYYQQYGITPLLQNWYCKEYPQQFNHAGFVPNLSILDLLFNVSPKEARKILTISRE